MVRHPRTKRAEPAFAAVVRVLEDAGITVPEHLDEIMAIDAPPREPPRPSPVTRARALVDNGWPERAVQYALDAKQTLAIDAVRAWDPKRRCVLVLAGGKGVGKTVAAAWCALHWPQRATFRFRRAAAIVRTSRFGDAFAELINAPLLCIDDIGAEYADAKGSFVADLDELVDSFYGDGRPLIFTTNAEGAALRERYGGRIMDRFAECATWAHVPGDSMRRQERAPWE